MTTDAEVLKSFDGAEWARHFRDTAIKLGYSDMDEGWLAGWFANALMRGYDEHRWREAKCAGPVIATSE